MATKGEAVSEIQELLEDGYSVADLIYWARSTVEQVRIDRHSVTATDRNLAEAILHRWWEADALF